MKISIAKKIEEAVIESLVDGSGIRLVIFLCGCPHKCPGCHNRETWDINSGIWEETGIVAEHLISLFNSGNYSGITISGGDPLHQPEATEELILRLREAVPDINIWVYTGFTYDRIKNLSVLEQINVLVDGPFIIDERYPRKKFRGSANQRILHLENGDIKFTE